MHASAAVATRVKALGVLAAGAMVLGSLEVAKAAEQSVDWTNGVNVTVRGNTLEKTGGCQGCDDAGAVSQQMIRSGDGYAEFTVGETNTFWLGGLGRADGDPSFNRIDFAFRFNGSGRADVMEEGAYQPGSDTTYAAGEVFRVAVARGKVQYTKNGRMVYESRRIPRYPLVLAAALGTIGATVQNARIEANDRSFTTNQYGGDRYRDRYDYDTLSTFDRNGDGVITRREWQGPRAEFDRLDINRDGVLSGREVDRGSADAVGTSGEQVIVDGRQRWVDTGLWVEAGDSITFDAQGTVQLSGNANDMATPAGAESGKRAGNAPMRGRPAGALIARIGDGPPILVGDHRTARAPTSGELYLGVNDDDVLDNRGQYRVGVTIEPRW